MGNAASAEEQERVGYRVLGVQPNSPASAAGLVAFFDFIVAANGVPLKTLDSTFIELIKEAEDKHLPLTIYNIKRDDTREVVIVPSRRWAGEGMLGVTIRFDTYHRADENLCHVMEVEEDSPAALAGLEPEKDYLLGTAEIVFKNPDILHDELQKSTGKPMEMYVYNSETDNVRVVVLLPTLEWGGSGLLGASIGHGYLHRLPTQCCGTFGTSVEGLYTALNSPFGQNLPDGNGGVGGSAIDPEAPPPRGDDPSVRAVDTSAAASASSTASSSAAPPIPPQIVTAAGAAGQPSIPGADIDAGGANLPRPGEVHQPPVEAS